MYKYSESFDYAQNYEKKVKAAASLQFRDTIV